jgi:hypothetical protein
MKKTITTFLALAAIAIPALAHAQVKAIDLEMLEKVPEELRVDLQLDVVHDSLQVRGDLAEDLADAGSASWHATE